MLKVTKTVYDEGGQEFVTIEEYDMEKKFKCKDEVIFRYDDGSGKKSYWTFGIFSHYQGDNLVAIGNIVYGLNCTEVLPYDGHEYLVGTKDEPDEEVIIKKGDLVYGFDSIKRLEEEYGVNLGKFERIMDDGLLYISGCNWDYCIPFSKLNPDDMEATRKEVLTVRNGKLVKANIK